ncbi:MAG: transporter, partial [Bacteroidetes bacterium]|nr:transporter [Bacteroidota bacterium]
MVPIVDLIRPFIRWVARHPGRIVVGAMILTLAGGWLTSRLTIDTDFARLIPSDYPSVRALNALQEAYGGESEAAVIIESPSFEANRRFAEDLIPRLLALKGRRYEEPYFMHADFRRDIGFLQQNALYFATTAELDSVTSYLRDRIEAARLEANPFYFDL